MDGYAEYMSLEQVEHTVYRSCREQVGTYIIIMDGYAEYMSLEQVEHTVYRSCREQIETYHNGRLC